MRLVTKTYEFDAAHRLLGYDGLCSNVHGHRYKVEICCSSPELDHQDMVVDFHLLKTEVKRWLDKNWDHALILNSVDPLYLALLDKKIPGVSEDFRLYSMDGNPTAELMAEELYDVIRDGVFGKDITVESVTVYETPTSFATFSQ